MSAVHQDWKLPDTPEQRRIAWLESLLQIANEDIGALRERLRWTEEQLAKERAK